MKKINLLLISILCLTSCGSLSEAGKVLRNEKVNSTDEFLIEKKDPLIMPPDYNKIPEPDSIGSKRIDDKDRIKKVLKNENVKVNKNQNKTTDVEKSIIDRIR